MTYSSSANKYIFATILLVIGSVLIFFAISAIQPVELPTAKIKPVIISKTNPQQLIYFEKSQRYDQYFLYDYETGKKQLIYQEQKTNGKKEFSLLTDNTVTISSASAYKKFSLITQNINNLSRGDIVVKLSPNNSYAVTYGSKPYGNKLTFTIRDTQTQATGSASLANPGNLIPQVHGWSKDGTRMFFSRIANRPISNTNPLYVLDVVTPKVVKFESDIGKYGPSVVAFDTQNNVVYFLSPLGVKKQNLDYPTTQQSVIATASAKTINKLLFSQEYLPDKIIYTSRNKIIMTDTIDGTEEVLVTLPENTTIISVVWKGNLLAFTSESPQQREKIVTGQIYNLQTKGLNKFTEEQKVSNNQGQAIDLIGWVYPAKEK